MEKEDSEKFVEKVCKGKNIEAEALLEKLLKQKVANRLKSVLKN